LVFINSIMRRAAIAQLASTSNKFHNLINVAQCAFMAKKEGASMLFLPECFGYIGSSATETRKNAEILEQQRLKNPDVVTSILKSIVNNNNEKSITEEGENEEYDNESIFVMDGLRSIAQASNLWISGGGIHETIPDDKDHVYNTHVILNDQGELIKKYRKIHLFDVSIPGQVELKESNTTRSGRSIEVCDSPLGVLGLTTCYDVRFPELYTELVKKGAQIMLVPSAFTVPTGSAHWHILLRARAIETQCYVLAAAQIGRHNEKRESYGHTLAVNPWGEDIADAKNTPGPTIITCDIDLQAQVDNLRQRMPIQQHRETAKGYR